MHALTVLFRHSQGWKAIHARGLSLSITPNAQVGIPSVHAIGLKQFVMHDLNQDLAASLPKAPILGLEYGASAGSLPTIIEPLG